MRFSIKCDVFNRLIKITKTLKPTTPRELVDLLSCLRLEYRKGHYYAIVCNQEIASIQYLGTTDQPDYAIHVINHESLIQQSLNETLTDSSIFIDVIPEFALATLSTSSGWVLSENACIFPDRSPMNDWINWFPGDNNYKNNGIMYWDADQISSLASSSSSGKLYFPEFIDVDKPVVIRDQLDENWCGLFIPKPEPTALQIRKGAEIPKWI